MPPPHHYCSVRCSYIETCSSILPHSEREFPIRGLNLIRLLIQNRIADFHTTLESLPLPADELIANPYIRHPVNLERWLMEGSYSKVWNAREEAPAEEYKFFIDSLMGTIRLVFCPLPVISSLNSRGRNEIASCEEAAYESLPLKDAATLLFFRSQSEVLDFAKQVRAQDLSMNICVLTSSCNLPAGLADRLDTRGDHIHSKGRGEARDTKREVDRQQSCICTRVGTDRIIEHLTFGLYCINWFLSLRYSAPNTRRSLDVKCKV